MIKSLTISDFAGNIEDKNKKLNDAKVEIYIFKMSEQSLGSVSFGSLYATFDDYEHGYYKLNQYTIALEYGMFTSMHNINDSAKNATLDTTLRLIDGYVDLDIITDNILFFNKNNNTWNQLNIFNRCNYKEKTPEEIQEVFSWIENIDKIKSISLCDLVHINGNKSIRLSENSVLGLYCEETSIELVLQNNLGFKSDEYGFCVKVSNNNNIMLFTPDKRLDSLEEIFDSIVDIT